MAGALRPSRTSAPTRSATRSKMSFGRWAIVLAVACSAFAPLPIASGQSERATRSYFTANGLLNRGLYEQAASEYRAFLEEAPQAETQQVNIARYGLAVCLAHLGESQDALDQLDQLDADEGFEFGFEAGFLEAQLRYADSQFKQAARDFRKLSRADHPKAREAGSLWIECLYRLGQYTSVVNAWESLDERGFFDDAQWSDDPALSGAALYAGLAMGVLGDDTRAVKVLGPLTQRDDAMGYPARLASADALVRLGNPDDARRLYEPLAQLDEAQWALPATLGLARLARADSDPESAITSIRALRKRFPQARQEQSLSLELGISLIETNKHREGRELLEPLATGSDDGALAPLAAYWLAKSHLRQGDAEPAIERLSDSIERFPDTGLLPEMLYDLGVASYEQGEFEHALEAFDRVVDLDPDSSIMEQAKLAGAKSLMALERYDLARRRAAKIQQDPFRTEAQLLVAQAQSLTGDRERSVKNLERWLRAHPNHASSNQARYQLAMGYAQLGELAKAESTLEPLFAEGLPDVFVPILLVLGDAATEAQQWDRAEHWYTLAVKHDPAQQHLAQLKLALTLTQQDKHAPAAELFERASQASDSDLAQQALFELGQSQLMLGSDPEAASTLRRLLDEAPDSRFAGYAMLHLGEIAERSGEWLIAAQWYDKAGRADASILEEAERSRGRALLAAGQLDTLSENASQSDDPELEAYAAIALARQGNCERAARQLKRLLRSGDLSAHTQRAAMYELLWCAKQAGDTDAAMELVDALTSPSDDAATDGSSIRPTESMSLYAALEGASIELDRGDLAASERWIQRATPGVQGSDDESLHAALDYRAARLDAARSHPRRVVERLKGFASTYPDHELLANAEVLLGDAYLELAQPQKAAQAYERAAEASSDVMRSAILLRLGDAHGQAQSWDQSRSAYETFLRETPDSEFGFEARFGLAWALEHLGHYDEARQHYAHVVEHHQGPTAARAQFQIGECLFAQKDYEQAVRELLRVDILYDSPQWNAAALYEAGRAFEQLRKFGEAREQFRSVLERFGQTQWAPLAQERLDQLAKNQ